MFPTSSVSTMASLKYTDGVTSEQVPSAYHGRNMTRHRLVFTGAAIATGMAIGLLASACGGSSDSGTTKTETETVTASATAGATTTTSGTPEATSPGGTDLQSLIPTPANTRQTDGPDSIAENGIHEHFEVNGSPQGVMDSYKAALEGKGWSLTVENSGGGGGGGGATYTGSNGDAYGVFTGGGYGDTTDIEACVWPSKPSNTDCDNDN